MKNIIIILAIMFCGCIENNPVEITQEFDYNEYTAIINQQGTNAPVATVLKNTLNKPVNFTRLQAGTYMMFCANKFTLMKTVVYIETAETDSTYIKTLPSNFNDIIYLYSYVWQTPTDNQIKNVKLTIRVYE